MGIVQSVVAGYRMGQAGRLVRHLLYTHGGMTERDADRDTASLLRVAYPVVDVARIERRSKPPHRAAVAAYALAAGVSLGHKNLSDVGLYYACCIALDAHLARIEAMPHLYRLGALDSELLRAAADTLEAAQVAEGVIARPSGVQPVMQQNVP